MVRFPAARCRAPARAVRSASPRWCSSAGKTSSPLLGAGLLRGVGGRDAQMSPQLSLHLGQGDDGAVRENGEALDEILQLSHIARPGLSPQQLEGVG